MEPAYYKTNLRSLTFAECRRFGGSLGKGLQFWLLRFIASPSGCTKLPQLQKDVVATRDEMSEPFLRQTVPLWTELQRLGCRHLFYNTIREWHDPAHIDAGGIVALAGDGRSVAMLNWTLRKGVSTTEQPDPPPVEVLALSFVAFLRAGTTLTVTNLRQYLDPLPGSRVWFLPTSDPGVLQERMTALLLSARYRNEVIRFSGADDVRQAMDDGELRTFRYRLEHKKLWTPMNAEEVAAATGQARTRPLPPSGP